VLEKPDFQSSELVAPQLGFVHKKGLHRRGRSSGQAVPDWRPLPRFHLLCLHVTSFFAHKSCGRLARATILRFNYPHAHNLRQLACSP
jgi:hypothetical protein